MARSVAILLLGLIIEASMLRPAIAVPQVAPDNLWADNLAWNCAVLAANAPEKSAARADLDRIFGVALAAKVNRQIGPVVPALKGKSDEFWQGTNYGAAADFVVTDLFARLPAGGGPRLLGETAAKLYDEKGCASLGR